MTESRNQKWNKSHSFTQLSATESDIFVKAQDRTFAKRVTFARYVYVYRRFQVRL